VFTAKSREPTKTKAEGTPGRIKPEVETAERVQANPLWHRLATRAQAKLTVSRVRGQVLSFATLRDSLALT
jgi:hypothetical protein